MVILRLSDGKEDQLILQKRFPEFPALLLCLGNAALLESDVRLLMSYLNGFKREFFEEYDDVKLSIICSQLQFQIKLEQQPDVILYQFLKSCWLLKG